MNTIQRLGVLLFLLLNISITYAQLFDTSWREIVNTKNKEWFSTNEAKEIAENVMLYQRNIGGWPKNKSVYKELSTTEKEELQSLKKEANGSTIDNGATYLEMIFLSKIYNEVKDERYKESFLAGLNYLLESQYKNGGWPQFYPLKKGYYSHVTYNDDAMVNVLKILRDISYQNNEISIIPPPETLLKVREAFNKGIECILKTQYKQNGVLTSWCAQYDKESLLPAKARTYELKSLSGKESANIVLLLMSLKNPSAKIVQAIVSAIAWFEVTKIKGLKKEHYITKTGLKEKRYTKDANAPALWARFMELDDNTPFFCDRDGIKKSAVMEIGQERRAGYAWYTHDPQEAIDKFKKWKKKYLKKRTSKKHSNEFLITVAKDGSGDYTNIQEAINNTKSFPSKRVIIHIKNGVYHEKVKIHEWNTRISLIGESKENTIITYDDYFDKIDLGRNSTFHTATLQVDGNDFYATNLTIENAAGEIGQAIALMVNADRVQFDNCSIKGNQDTLYVTGESNKQYFKNCFCIGTPWSSQIHF